MESSHPSYVVPMAVGAAADVRLDRILGVTNARLSIIIPTLNAARNGFGVPGPLAPPAARGQRAWSDGTEELRLRLVPHGWRVPDLAALNAAGFVESADGTTAIALVAGDTATGLSSYNPQVRYPRGPVSVEVVQGSMLPELVREQAPRINLYYLMHDISSSGWRAEFSQPASFGATGWVSSWTSRIQIVNDPPTTNDPTGTRVSPELPEPPVRWRESA